MYSDNGLNFVGAEQKLREAILLLAEEETQRKLNRITSHDRVQWHFNPKRAPHRIVGGWSESHEDPPPEDSGSTFAHF